MARSFAPTTIIFFALLLKTLGQTTNGCDNWLSYYNYCESATPSLSQLPRTSQLACLCSGPTWNPGEYNSAWAQCAADLAAEDPTFFSSVTSEGGGIDLAPCTAAQSSFRAASGSTSRSNSLTTSSGNTNEDNCELLVSWADICATYVPSFSLLPFSSQAACYCYPDGSYAPQTYDSVYRGCLSYYRTATDPAIQDAYSSLTSKNGGALPTAPCASVGDVITFNGASATDPIISDPTTDKAAAAMSVRVGHLSDPEQLQGLACVDLGSLTDDLVTSASICSS